MGDGCQQWVIGGGQLVMGGGQWVMRVRTVGDGCQQCWAHAGHLPPSHLGVQTLCGEAK